MNIKLDHFHIFVVYSDWASDEFFTLEEAREFIQKSVSNGSAIADFSIEGRMHFGVE